MSDHFTSNFLKTFIQFILKLKGLFHRLYTCLVSSFGEKLTNVRGGDSHEDTWMLTLLSGVQIVMARSPNSKFYLSNSGINIWSGIQTVKCKMEYFTIQISDYSGGSNTKHVRISNGKGRFGIRMVQFSNGKTRWPPFCHKMAAILFRFRMVRTIRKPNHG